MPHNHYHFSHSCNWLAALIWFCFHVYRAISFSSWRRVIAKLKNFNRFIFFFCFFPFTEQSVCVERKWTCRCGWYERMDFGRSSTNHWILSIRSCIGRLWVSRAHTIGRSTNSTDFQLQFQCTRGYIIDHFTMSRDYGDLTPDRKLLLHM